MDNKNSNDDENSSSTQPEPQQKSQLMAFLKQLASFTGDLSQLTAPAFLLNGSSLLEYSVHWCDYPQLLYNIPCQESAELRMLAVVKWFMSTLYGSYHERCANGATERKPYNPILGEQFFADWLNGDLNEESQEKLSQWQRAHLIVEQVSHHPPVSAFHVRCSGSAGDFVTVTGHCGQKTKFSSMAIKVAQSGHAVLHCDRHDEHYLIKLPELVIRGLLSGQMFLELTGSVDIRCSNGMMVEIEFLPKPWFSGDYHSVRGSIYRADSSDATLFSLSGRWVDTVYYREGAAGRPMSSKKKRPSSAATDDDGDNKVLFKVDLKERPPVTVKPIGDMNSLESKKVWQKVTEALLKEEYDVASQEKNAIEERQRESRKLRQQSGEEWQPEFFEWVQPGSGSNDSVQLLQEYVNNSEIAPKEQPSADIKHPFTDAGGWRLRSVKNNNDNNAQ